MDSIKALSKFAVNGRQVSGNKHDATAGVINDDEIGEWKLPRLATAQVDYTALQTAALATFPKFYLDDDSSSIAGYSPTEVIPGVPFVKAKYCRLSKLCILELTALPIALQNTSANLWFTLPLLTWPFGVHNIYGGSCNLSIDWNYQTYLQASGTAVVKTTAAGNIAFGSAAATSTTLSSTIVDAMASTAFGTVAVGKSKAAGKWIVPTRFDWSTTTLTSTAATLNMSGSVTTGGAASSAQIVPITGTITFFSDWMGDF